ncbi:MFS transporter [Pseudalkalibacillus hwajinpoensis]|uniref:MFS transporter n=1 Tax=Guptibacillus hwajinpoensis TaxID=208199 RepID=A0A4U1MDM3_9BACL|nr:MFS transporter [Pseudalkalibacillus hwajinpoensis]TKD68843.1 MFS transporter [Pseudalkalibacillus hwajinpoensis]
MKKRDSVFYLSLFLFFFHASNTIIISYMPVYFQHSGMSESKIGSILAIGPLAAILAQPFWGYISDKTGTIKKVLLVTLIGVFIVSVFLLTSQSYILILFSAAIFYVFMSPTGALGDSLAVKTAARFNKNFGSIRTWGSIGFASSTLLVGQFFSFAGIEFILLPFLFMITFAFLTAMKISDVKTGNKPVTVLDAVRIGKNPRFLFFLAAIMFLTIPHRANDSFIGIYLTELGGNESQIGIAWFVAVASEAVIFATSHYWFRKYNEIVFIFIAGLIYALRWIILAYVSGPIGAILMQVLHGVTFGVFYVSAFQYVTKLVPANLQATGHLLFISVFFGLSGILGSLFGGIIFEEASGSALYSFMGYMSLVGCIVLLAYMFFDRKRSKTKTSYA